MLKEANYQDLGVVEETIRGADLVGEAPATGVFNSKFRPAKRTVGDLMECASAEREAVLQSIKPQGEDTDKAVLEQTLDEVSKGWASGPLDPGQLPQHAVISRRFGLVQPGKIRLIDDLSASGINDTVQAEESPTPRTVDVAVGMCAEAHVLGLPKPLPANDRLAMKVALEASLGALEDRDEPSSTYLALKLEEVEAGELRASLLDEVTCTVDEINANFQSSVDSSGRLRLTKERKKAKLPTGSEELRQRLRVEAHTLLMLAARFSNKTWFQGLASKDFLLHVDFVLGDKVYLLQMVRPEGGPTMQYANPSWQLVLNYEHRLRKEAYKMASRNNRSLVDALKEARENAALKETHFVGPLALEMASRSNHHAGPPLKYQKFEVPPPPTADPSWGSDRKGKGKGKGKFLGKPSRSGFVFRKTPDGREICYGYNNGTCPGNCGRVHVCQLCLKPHPRSECKNRVEKPAADGKTGAKPS